MTDKTDDEKRAETASKAKALRAQDLKNEHGDVAAVELGGATYYFRKPTLPEYQRCMDGITKDKGAGVPALRTLLFACSVGDDPDGAVAALPAAITPIGNAILEMGGSEVEVTISKA